MFSTTWSTSCSRSNSNASQCVPIFPDTQSKSRPCNLLQAILHPHQSRTPEYWRRRRQKYVRNDRSWSRLKLGLASACLCPNRTWGVSSGGQLTLPTFSSRSTFVRVVALHLPRTCLRNLGIRRRRYRCFGGPGSLAIQKGLDVHSCGGLLVSRTGRNVMT